MNKILFQWLCETPDLCILWLLLTLIMLFWLHVHVLENHTSIWSILQHYKIWSWVTLNMLKG